MRNLHTPLSLRIHRKVLLLLLQVSIAAQNSKIPIKEIRDELKSS